MERTEVVMTPGGLVFFGLLFILGGGLMIRFRRHVASWQLTWSLKTMTPDEVGPWRAATTAFVGVIVVAWGVLFLAGAVYLWIQG